MAVLKRFWHYLISGKPNVGGIPIRLWLFLSAVVPIMVWVLLISCNAFLYHARHDDYIRNSKLETKWVFIKNNCPEISEALIKSPIFVRSEYDTHVSIKYYSIFDSCIKECKDIDEDPIPCWDAIYKKNYLNDDILRPMYDSINKYTHDFALLHNSRTGVGQFDILIKGYHQDSSIVEFIYYVDTNVRLENVSGFVLREHVHNQPAPLAWQRRTNAYLDSLDKLGGRGKRKIK